MNEGLSALLVLTMLPAVAAVMFALEERKKAPIPAAGTSLKLTSARAPQISRTITQRP